MNKLRKIFKNEYVDELKDSSLDLEEDNEVVM